ncbi:lysoplasmalogenase [Vibrio fluvialis]
MWPTILLLSSIHLFTIERGPRWLFYSSKPLPVLLMAALITLSPTVDANLAFWIFSGLILSAIGDVLLSLPKDKFISGLSSFLLAHICYVLGFIGMVNTISWWIPVMILALGVLAFLLLLPNLGTMTLPVAIYILIIVAMGSATAEYWFSYNSSSARLAFTGACIFMVSDLVLAIDRFRSSSKFSRHVVMFTYYTAQALLTLSVLDS